MVAIAPLLEKRGLHVMESGGGNYTVREHPGLVIKDAYWRWPERNLSGNAIDLCMQVLPAPVVQRRHAGALTNARRRGKQSRARRVVCRAA